MKNVDKLRQQIVEKHLAALMQDLVANGYDALGVAGGIVMAAGPKDTKSECHVFYICDKGIVANGETFNADGFIIDVAATMIKGLSETSDG